MHQLQRIGCGATASHIYRHCRRFREICRYPVTHWGAKGGHHCYSLGVQEAHRLDEHLQDHSGKPCNVHSLDAPAGMFQQLLQIPSKELLGDSASLQCV